ncbi:MAG TPA: hypothetical protein VF221_00670 [Chloroflexota bacterium]
MEGIDRQPRAWAVDERTARGESAAPTLWDEFSAACEHDLLGCGSIERWAVSPICWAGWEKTDARMAA